MFAIECALSNCRKCFILPETSTAYSTRTTVCAGSTTTGEINLSVDLDLRWDSHNRKTISDAFAYSRSPLVLQINRMDSNWDWPGTPRTRWTSLLQPKVFGSLYTIIRLVPILLERELMSVWKWIRTLEWGRRYSNVFVPKKEGIVSTIPTSKSDSTTVCTIFQREQSIPSRWKYLYFYS